MSMVYKISIKHVESTATDRLEPQNRISSQCDSVSNQGDKRA